ncbi:hypothetical protein FACS1894169_01160 [Bacteroidia bacterium]|nr:hypothetical protein FACS1894169_01160 [Bacteroidia bacterium]
MDKINFFSGDKFPQYRQALAKMQEMTNLVAALAGMGGKNFILSGCEDIADGKVSDGLIVINGELMPFKGSTPKDRITIIETREDVTAFGVNYPETYIIRVAAFSDTGEYLWENIERIKTNIELYKLIRDITGDPAGVVKSYAGFVSKIPADYLLCDGRYLAPSDYPELFEAIGTIWGGDGVSTFRLPPAGGRVIAGFSGNEAYTQGNLFGSDTITLNESQLPPHKHIIPWGENPTTAWSPPWGYASGYEENQRGSNQNDSDNAWAYSSPVGQNTPIDIRQSAIVFVQIIKVR